MKRISLLFLFLIFGAAACSTGRPTLQAPQARVSSQNSGFDLSYSISGHGAHRLSGTAAKGGVPEVASYLDRQVVDEAKVNAERYELFLAKLQSFTQKTQRTPSQDRECRSHYSVSLKIEGKTYSSKGCRNEDDGTFAKLVREGEFLLYSKK